MSAAPLSLGAQTVALPAAADSYLKSGSPNRNQGEEALLRVQSSGDNRALVQFDPAAIEAAVGSGSLASARLELFISENADNWGAEGRTVDAHRLSEAWTESGTTWNCPEDSNPANGSPDCPAPWAGGSFEEEPSDTVLHKSGLAGWIAFDVTADVAAFLAGGIYHGWLIKKTEEEQNGRVEYASREDSSGDGPRLVLVVESPAFDEVPPRLAVTSPAEPVLVNEPSPTVAVEYSDGGSGVDPGSLEVLLDGADVTATSAVGPTSATCAPGSVAAGSHTVEARLRDQADNLAAASRSFELLAGPGLHTVRIPLAADTYLRQGAPNQNQGGEGFVRLQQSGKNRVLLKVDAGEVAGLLAGATVRSARLELFIEENGDNWGAAGRTVDLHRLAASWTEDGATWHCAQDADPTDQKADCDPQWDGGSFEPTPAATLLITKGLAGRVELDVTADVAAMAGGATHLGWLLKKTAEGQSGRVEFTSREGTPAQEPGVVVVFELGGGVDTSPPAVSLDRPADGGFTAQARPTVSATFSDGESGIDVASVRLFLDGEDRTAEATVTASGLTFVPPEPLADDPHLAVVRVSDQAGNEAEAEAGFVVDTVAPALAVVAPADPVVIEDPTPAIEIAYSDSTSGLDLATLRFFLDGVERTASCTVGPSAATCEPPALAPGGHTISAHVRDRADNLAASSRVFELRVDTEPPAVTITAPAAVVLGDPTPAVRVEYADEIAGVDLASFRLFVDGADQTAGCAVGAATAECEPSPLGRGQHLVVAEVADLKGNVATTERSFAVAFPVELAFTSPSPNSVLPSPFTRVTGTVSEDAATVEVNGVAASLAGGTFTVESLGLHDGANHVVAVARDGGGNVGTATLRLYADTTPPQVSITSPSGGARLGASAVMVTGLVNDLTIGTVSETEVTVSVNGVPASVAHRSFLARDVPLAPGLNTLTVLATDRAGNLASAAVEVRFEPPAGAPSLRPVAGDGQTGPILGELLEPLVVEVLDAAGAPRPGAQVIFRVVQGDGAFSGGDRVVMATTGAQGRASQRWRLGRRAGAAVHRVRATAVGVAGEAGFVATATPTAPASIHVAAGDNQRGLVGAALAQPLIAVVFDAGDNPLAGVPVSFRAVEGGGTFAGAETVVVETDGSGLAVAHLTLGLEPGFDNHLVEAAVAGLGGLPAVFKASAAVPGEPAATELAGVVLDNQGDPVPEVTLRLRDTALLTTTDEQGVFRLTAVPMGRVFLLVDPSTTSLPGQWASLEFELFTLPGVVNTLPRPIYILPLDLSGAIYVDETRGGTVTLPDVPGFALEVAPGSVTFPGGGRSGVVSVTAVHADRIPMAPGAGMQPKLIVTVQPAGAHFDPPARFTLPNVDALAPGTVTELFSFDHDLGAFVAIGTGTVSEDGLVLSSDPGFGILEAGWACGSLPSGRGSSGTLTITVEPEAVTLVAGRTPPETSDLLAGGDPSADAVYAWSIADSSTATLDPSGEGLCPDEPTCRTTVTAREPGRTTATAEITCTTTGRKASDQAEILVVEVEDVDVHETDPETAEVPSALAGSDLLHFVTARQQGDVVLIADVQPDLPEVRDSITWESTAIALTSPAIDDDKRTVRFSSEMSVGRKIPITIRVAGKPAREIMAWVVSAEMWGSVGQPVAMPLFGGSLRAGTMVQAVLHPRAVIQPPQIILDADRPKLAGPSSHPPGGLNTCGQSLAGGVAAKWDISRRIAVRASTVPTALSGVLGCVDFPTDYPTDPIIGNDDAGAGEEDNDPYSPSDVGQLVGLDDPWRIGPGPGGLRAGHVGDTYTSQLWFEEFARLELNVRGGHRWFVISDSLPWRVTFRFRKIQVTEALWKLDANSDNDLLDDITEQMLNQDLNGPSSSINKPLVRL